MEYNVIHLSKDEWKGYAVPIKYTADGYYDVKIKQNSKGYNVGFTKKAFKSPVFRSSEVDGDFQDRLYADWWEKASAWGVVIEGKLKAVIETCPEEWSDRLRITELWVDEKLRGKGIAKRLMNIAKEQARLESRRAIILETQSCNINAIGFYQSQGFSLIGFDTCCYSNNDLKNKEVRMEFGYFLTRGKKLKRKGIIIRPEKPDDCYDTEYMVRRAFWNLHRPGCDEHLLVKKLRTNPAYLPGISRVAEVEGKIAGCIMYCKACVETSDGRREEVLTFGPLAVDPEFQNRGVGGYLLKETINLAKKADYKGIIIFGEPGYYPRRGFVTCDKYSVTTSDGKNFAAFMARELTPGGFDGIKGRFIIPDVYTKLTKEETEEFDKKFPSAEKVKFPFHWD